MNSILAKHFSQFFYFFVIFSAVPVPIPHFLNGETILTTGTENVPTDAFNIRPELFFTQMVPITFYNAADQCHLQAGNEEVLPMSLVFFLPKEALNAGAGITICYKGQLDQFTNLEYGLTPPNALRVNNLAQNEVAQICGDKLHGFSLKEDENGEKIILTMSTTMNQFEIDRAMFRGGFLVLKLARWDSLISGFDKQIGNDNRFVNIPGDMVLQKAYFRNIFAGARLAGYFGPWALGVDMLPGDYAADEPFQLFVNRSSCSEMAILFKLSSEPANLKFVPPKRISKGVNVTSKESAVITENVEILVRGKIVGQQQFFFQIRLAKRAIGMEEILAYRMNFTFNEKGKNAAIQMERFNDAKWSVVDGPKFYDKLLPDKHFLMKAIYQNFALDVIINCGQFQKYSLGLSNKEKQMIKSIKNANEYKFSFNGGVEIYAVSIGGKQLDEWTVGEQISEQYAVKNFTNRLGFMIRGELLPDPKWAIKIEVKAENGAGFKFEANSMEILLPSGKTIPNDKIKAGGHFEGFFILKNKQLITMFNEGQHVLDSFEFEEQKQINIEVDANFDAGSLIFNELFGPQGLFRIKQNQYFEKGATIVFVGKIPKYSKGFTLGFLNYGEESPKAIGSCIYLPGCENNLRISVDFGNQTTDFMQSPQQQSEWVNVEHASPNPFYPGMEFRMLISAIAHSRPGFNITIQDSINGEWLASYTYESQNIKVKGIEIDGDIFSIDEPGFLESGN